VGEERRKEKKRKATRENRPSDHELPENPATLIFSILIDDDISQLSLDLSRVKGQVRSNRRKK
jgi:hypothetical protein